MRLPKQNRKESNVVFFLCSSFQMLRNSVVFLFRFDYFRTNQIFGTIPLYPKSLLVFPLFLVFPH